MMVTRPIDPIVFAYNFPHKKTQDFIQRLVFSGCGPRVVLAADPVKLDLPRSAIRVKPRHCDLIEPRELCKRFDIPYCVVDHQSERCVEILREYAAEVGLVAGARILSRRVIDCFSVGIINFHPGLIPEARGLDALQWAIYHELPIGVTSHLIDHRVDAGLIVGRRVIREYADDTLIDLSLRLYETQIDMLNTTLERLASTDRQDLEPVGGGEYRRSFPPELVPVLQAKLESRLTRLRSAA